MKASQVISELQDLVKKYGDREIRVNGLWDSDIPLTHHSRLEIEEIDLFEDSANFQLIINNSI